MKRFLLLFLALPVFAAPSTPITRGRLTTDLDAGGHTVTNSNLATTNFVWEVVGAVTNNLPSGGVDEGAVRGIVDAAIENVTADSIGAAPIESPDFVDYIEIDGNEGNPYIGIGRLNGHPVTTIFKDRVLVFDDEGNHHDIYFPTRGPEDSFALESDLAGLAARTNLPPLSASATVGDLVDRVNAVMGALR